jgi:hypothetical protein
MGAPSVQGLRGVPYRMSRGIAMRRIKATAARTLDKLVNPQFNDSPLHGLYWRMCSNPTILSEKAYHQAA